MRSQGGSVLLLLLPLLVCSGALLQEGRRAMVARTAAALRLTTALQPPWKSSTHASTRQRVLLGLVGGVVEDAAAPYVQCFDWVVSKQGLERCGLRARHRARVPVPDGGRRCGEERAEEELHRCGSRRWRFCPESFQAPRASGPSRANEELSTLNLV